MTPVECPECGDFLGFSAYLEERKCDSCLCDHPDIEEVVDTSEVANLKVRTISEKCTECGSLLNVDSKSSESGFSTEDNIEVRVDDESDDEINPLGSF